MKGIDVSSAAESTVDWVKLRASGKSFAFVRASFGTRHDPAFASYWKDMREAGVLRGAYHFLKLKDGSVTQAEAQAATFLDGLGRLVAGDLPPVLDIEGIETIPAGQVVAAARTWLATVESALRQQTGRVIKPIIYTSRRIWRLLEEPAGFADHPLWVADWARAESPRCPSTWGDGQWTFHQYAGDVRGVVGVSGKADLNQFGGLSVGASGRRVEQLKRALVAAGVGDGLSESVLFDDTTRASVQRFQEHAGLTVDGIVGPFTWSRLLWA